MKATCSSGSRPTASSMARTAGSVGGTTGARPSTPAVAELERLVEVLDGVPLGADARGHDFDPRSAASSAARALFHPTARAPYGQLRVLSRVDTPRPPSEDGPVSASERATARGHRRRRLRRALRRARARRRAGLGSPWSTGATTTSSSRCSTRSPPPRLNPADIAAPHPLDPARASRTSTCSSARSRAIDLAGAARARSTTAGARATTTSSSPPARRTPTSATTSGSRSRPGLKTLEDALEIRRRVLLAYEAAERERGRGRAARRC